MKRIWPILIALLAFALAGCSEGVPRAVTPQTSVDLGPVPVAKSMTDTIDTRFEIANEGTGRLKLSDIQVKTLEGC